MAQCSHEDRRIRRWFCRRAVNVCPLLRMTHSNKQMTAGVDGVSGNMSSCFCVGVGGKHKIKQKRQKPSVYTPCFVFVSTCESVALWR